MGKRACQSGGNVVQKFYPVSLTIEERNEVRYDMFPKLRLCTDGGREQN